MKEKPKRDPKWMSSKNPDGPIKPSDVELPPVTEDHFKDALKKASRKAQKDA